MPHRTLSLSKGIGFDTLNLRFLGHFKNWNCLSRPKRLKSLLRTTSQKYFLNVYNIVISVIEPILDRNYPQKLPKSGETDFSDKLLTKAFRLGKPQVTDLL